MKNQIFITLIAGWILIGCNKQSMDAEYFQMKSDVLLLSDYCLESPELKIVRKSSDHGSIKFSCDVKTEMKDEIIQKSSELLKSKKYILKIEKQERYRWCKSDGTVLELNVAKELRVSSYLNSMDCK